jgi:peptidoglycan hydrolase-like protein with peptidoglycan-binding domain
MTTSGVWVRRGSTIVVELPDELAHEGLSSEIGGAGQPTVRVGSRGSVVQTLQARLQALGFSPGPIDGIFGSGTDAAVRAFQRSRGLGVDGIAGPQTWGALYAASAPPSQPQAPPSSWSPWTPPASGGGRRAVHLTVPFHGYQSNDRDGCFRRCTEMAAAVGVRVGGPDVRIQVAIREDTKGHVTVDPVKAQQGVAYIDGELDAGRPVVVGVSYTDAAYNVDDITDHFVIITGRDTDPQRGVCYGFHDPASSYLSRGGDQNPANRFFFYGSAAGGLYRPANSAAPLGSTPYDVAMVRRNV